MKVPFENSLCKYFSYFTYFFIAIHLDIIDFIHMENLEFIKDKPLKNEIRKKSDSEGNFPDYVRLSFNVPTETAIEFIRKVESRKMRRVADNSVVNKHDIISQLMFLWALEKKNVDMSECIFNQMMPNTVRYPKTTGRRGRPRIHPEKPTKPKNPNEKRGRPRTKHIQELDFGKND